MKHLVLLAACIAGCSSPSAQTVSSPASNEGNFKVAAWEERGCSDPVYPPESEATREEGAVDVLLFISREGQVLDTKIKQSSGHQRLDDAAVAAFKSCKFKVKHADDESLGTWFPIRFNWKLDRP